MVTRTIPLSEPVTLHDKTHTEIRLREPTGGMLLDFGEPRIYSRTADGSFFGVEDRVAVASYLNACVENEGGVDLLKVLTLADMRAVKTALYLFFDGAPDPTKT